VLGTLVCAVAALPMGLSIPAALRALDPPEPASAATFRRLYAWNTLGAVAGVLAGAGFLLERLGNRGTVVVASGAQGLTALLAAVLALAWSRRGRPADGAQTLPPPAAPPLMSPPARSLRAPLAAFLAGGAGLAVQVAWVRRLTPAVGTTTQAFATVLAAYLVALALGSLLLGPRRGSLGGRGAAWVLLLGALPVALLPAAIGPVARGTAEQALTFAGDEADLLWLRAAAAALLLVPSALLGAAALPWLVRREGGARAEGTRRVGRLLAWNTAGSAVLALATGLVWLPAVGSAGVLRGAAGLMLLGAGLLVPRRAAALLTALALGLLAQPFVVPVEDAAGRDAVGASFLPGEYGIADAPAVFFAEGRATTVVVRDREGRRELWVEGKIEASSQPTDLLHLTLLGSLPMALHPAPARVGIIGLGTGRTAQAVAAFGPKRLVVFELESEVLRAAPLFEPEGAGLPAGAEVVLGDARRSLLASAERFDVLTSDPIHPGVAGSAALYAREAYEVVKERLAPGGLFCQWLPLYQMRAEDLRLVARTFVAAFPATYLFQSGSDLVLVGAAAPLALEESALRARLAGPGGARLVALGLRPAGRLLSLLVRDPDGVRRFARDGEVNTDDRLVLEFRAGRAWFVRAEAENAKLLSVGRADPAVLVAGAPSAAFLAEVQVGELHRAGIRAWLRGERTDQAEAFAALAAADPEDRFSARMRDGGRLARVFDLLDEGRDDEAREVAAVLAQEPTLDEAQRLDLADAYRVLGDLEASRALAEAVRRTRDSPRARRLAAP
jgi:spermidine synthase